MAHTGPAPHAASDTQAGAQRRHNRNSRLVALVVAGMLCLNYPILFVFASSGLVFGIPVLYLYLFLAWAMLIVLAAAIVDRRPPGDHARADRET